MDAKNNTELPFKGIVKVISPIVSTAIVAKSPYRVFLLKIVCQGPPFAIRFQILTCNLHKLLFMAC